VSIKVRILYSEGCVHTPLTLDLVKSISSQMSLDIDLEATLVTDRDQAETLNFIGSPTVLVEGRDIDSSAAGTRFEGFG
jgi:hypothetical protein